MKPYEHKTIESKWQARWKEARLFATPELNEGEKGTYILDMFPFPSGSGLHVGHLLGYTGSDIVARVARMQGKKVLHPMGWDAFGLPAENYALKSGIHPVESTAINTSEYKRQFNQAGISFDWDKEINTSDPEYYKWTQWLFALLYKRGLAYRKEGFVNWCPKDQTVLANEQVINGHCERCGTPVVQRELKQWYFKITDYAERLIADLETVDWPEKIKAMQRNWIGRSEGVYAHFEVPGSETIKVFTTRPDTIFGATYLVLAPEHSLVSKLVAADKVDEVRAYQEEARRKSEIERLHLDKKKSGVFTGAYAKHPLTGTDIPIWVSDYVLSTYGTGAVMAVPAHDERDYEFAQKFNLPVIQVIGDPAEPLPYTGTGKLVNSEEFSGKNPEEILNELIAKMGAEKVVTYKLRDWLVSRQRYWGAPIPIAYDETGAEYLIPESQLPVELPYEVQFNQDGKSPLLSAKEWLTFSQDGKTMTREVDTLDGFVCSSWYYLRFPTPHLENAPFDSGETKKWLPVDTYMGGAEHAVLHLLYARFITKVLFDEGLIDFTEPFKQLRNQGNILAENGAKMSKSKPETVVNPDEVIASLGADTLRTYEMFMAPFDVEKPWSTTGILGSRRFLEKVWRLEEKVVDREASIQELSLIHRAIKKVTEDIADFKFNTCVSTMMETANGLQELQDIAESVYVTFITLLSPFAPHIAEELWESLGQLGFASVAPWPTWDEQYLTSSTWECPVQINGKIRAKLTLSRELSEDAVKAAAEADPVIKSYLEGKKVEKVVVVPGRLISYVVS